MSSALQPVLSAPKLPDPKFNARNYPALPFVNQCASILQCLSDPRQKVIWQLIFYCCLQNQWQAVPISVVRESEVEAMFLMIQEQELLMVRVEGKEEIHLQLSLTAVRSATIL